MSLRHPVHANMHTYSHTYMHGYKNTYVYANTHTCIQICIHTNMQTYIHTYIHANIQTCIHICIHAYVDMGWLWLIGSIKFQVSFAKEPYKTDDILQKRPMILSILLTVATPYIQTYIQIWLTTAGTRYILTIHTYVHADFITTAATRYIQAIHTHTHTDLITPAPTRNTQTIHTYILHHNCSHAIYAKWYIQTHTYIHTLILTPSQLQPSDIYNHPHTPIHTHQTPS